MVNLEKFASKGYQVAFASKQNKDKYARMLKQHGYRATVIRSSGPTVDKNPNGKKAFYVIPEKSKTQVRKVRRVARGYGGLLGMSRIKVGRF